MPFSIIIPEFNTFLYYPNYTFTIKEVQAQKKRVRQVVLAHSLWEKQVS